MFTLIYLPVVVLTLGLLALGIHFIWKKLFGTRMPATGSRLAAHVPGALDSLTQRAVLIAVLALLMSIPLAFVDGIVSERDARHREVLTDIARTWGQEQTLSGPVLAVPFTEARVIEEDVVDENGKASTSTRTVRKPHTAYFLPKTLDMDITLSDEIRERGLYRSLVYDADIAVQAAFDPAQVDTLSDLVETVHWDKAWVAIGLSDTRAINDVSVFSWNGVERALSPGTRMRALGAGFHAPVSAEEAGSYVLDVQLSAKGSGSFGFAPFGETTRVSLRSAWPHPSFKGSALPNEHDISDAGFTADWTVPHLARNYPQSWVGDREGSLFEFTAGVSLFETVSLYSQVTRAVKYGLLFIGLTYLTLLIFEIALARQLHPVQYALVGVALSVFFLMLLALSEHLGFLVAYLSAATVTILMIAAYTGAVLRSASRGIGILLLLVGLYAILYSLLQLEDYALLLGTALLVGVIATLMLVTRNLHRRERSDAPLEEKAPAPVQP